MGNPIYLGVNIDHVAMIRQARGSVILIRLQPPLKADSGGG